MRARPFANVVAAELYDRALRAADEVEPPAEDVARVAEALGDVCELFAAYERADAAYERAVSARRAESTRRGSMRKRGVLRERQGEYDDGDRPATSRLLASLPESDDPVIAGSRADVELAYAGVVFRQGDFDCAIEHAENAVAVRGARRATCARSATAST